MGEDGDGRLLTLLLNVSESQDMSQCLNTIIKYAKRFSELPYTTGLAFQTRTYGGVRGVPWAMAHGRLLDCVPFYLFFSTQD